MSKSVWKKDNRKPKPVLTDREKAALEVLTSTVEMLLSMDAPEIDALKAHVYHSFTGLQRNSTEIHFGVQLCLDALDSVEAEVKESVLLDFTPEPCEEHGEPYCDCDK